MHAAAEEGVMPREMSYSGYNLDIVTGASAALLAILLFAGAAPRALVLAWNLVRASADLTPHQWLETTALVIALRTELATRRCDAHTKPPGHTP